MSAMSNGNGKMRYEELQASLTSLPNGASGADASDFDAICNLTAKLYLQLNSKRPEAASGERETANRRAYLRDVTEHVQRRFDATVNTMKLDAGACERPEETAGRGTQSRMVARLQRLFKRSQTVGDEASVPATHPAVVCSRSYAPQVALSSVEDSSNSTSSGNTGTGSSALSNDARGATVKQADVLLCVTDLGGLLRPKRSKFSRVHAMLRRDERDHVLEFYAPNSGTNTNANANATGKRAPPKHGIICRLIDTLRFTTCFERNLNLNGTATFVTPS